jgi:ferredoxin
VRVTVNGSCQGCGVCEATAPAVFQVTEEGTATVLLDSVPEQHHQAVRDAAKECPNEAVEISG